MRIPGFDIEFPTNPGKVLGSYTHPQSKRSVACIGLAVQGAHLGNQQREDHRFFKMLDEQAGKLLDTFVSNGVRVICLDHMEGYGNGIAAIASPIAAVLRRHSVTPFGVDNLALVRKMSEVINYATMSSSQYQRLFLTFSRIVLPLISQHTSPMIARFITLREGYDQERIGYCEVSSELNQLSQALNIRVPKDIRRVLIALAGQCEMDEKVVNQEQSELLERLKKNAEAGVFDPEMMTTYRRAALEASGSDELHERSQIDLSRAWLRNTDRRLLDYARTRLGDASSLYEGFQVDFSPVRLKGFELRALDYARTRLGLELVVERFISSSDDEHASQSASLSRQARYEGSEVSLNLFRSVEHLETIYNLAHLLGIDMQAYPQLSRYSEFAHMLLEFGGQDFQMQVLQTVEQAWVFFEKHIPKTSQERHLMMAMRRYRLLRKLSLLRLTPYEYDDLIENLDDCSLSKVVETLSHLGIGFDMAAMPEIAQFDQRRDFLRSFYDNTRQRASSMALRTLEHMDTVQANQAVLICLGFHLPTIMSIWSGQPISYSIIVPTSPTRNETG